MAYTEADLEARIVALEMALDRHERTVQYADRSVTYNSTAEIRERIDYFSSALARLRARGKQTYLVGNKGF